MTDAGDEATFISVPAAGHSVEGIIGAEEFTVFRTNRGGQEKVADEPTPTWENVEHFIHVALSRARGGTGD